MEQPDSTCAPHDENVSKFEQDKRKASAHILLGHAKFGDSKFQLAIAQYGKAWDISKQLEDKELEMNATKFLGGAYIKNNQVQKAIDCFSKSRKIAKEHGYKDKETTVLVMLGNACTLIDEYQTEAIAYLNEALESAKEQKDRDKEAEALLGLGHAYKLTNEVKKAIEYFEKTMSIAKEQADRDQEGRALFSLGETYRLDKQFQNTIKYCEEALSIAKELEDKSQEMKILYSLILAYEPTLQFSKALQYSHEFLRIAVELEDQDHKTIARRLIRRNSFIVDLDPENDTHQTLPSTSQLAQLQDTQHENVHNVNEIDETRKSAEQLVNDPDSSNGVTVQNTQDTQHESVVNVDLVDIKNKKSSFQNEDSNQGESSENADVSQKQMPDAALPQTLLQSQDDEESFEVPNVKKRKRDEALQLADDEENIERSNRKRNKRDLETHNDTHQMLPNASDVAQLQDTQHENDQKSSELWRWEGSSITHREKFLGLLEYRKIHPEEIQVVNGVRFCCNEKFLIGKGSDGTRVYVGLAEDGYERAVKCMRKDACAALAEQEKKALNKYIAKKSNHVVRYWRLDDTSDKQYLFLILDLCEETLEKFIADSDLKDLVSIAPDIIRQILEGLVDIQSPALSILHRDLKPSNILRNVDGDWLLADFGVSKILLEGASAHPTNQKGAEDWRAVESSYTSTGMTDNVTVRYKKKSDIQVAGMVAFHIVTKGEHPFGEKRYRLDNLLNGQPVGLDTLEDPILKDLLSWMLSHDPKNRPSAKQALKHPYLQPAKQRFEMLCKVGNQREIKTQADSEVVKKLNGIPVVRTTEENGRVVKYLRTHSVEGTSRSTPYGTSWTETLRLIRNVNEHWYNRPFRAVPVDIESLVGDPQEYFSNLFPYLPVEVYRIIRTSDWKERPDLKEYFI